MDYLFQVNIGPVQSFIASARRTRDLHYGSYLLSELAKAAAKEIVDNYSWDSLIFPAPDPKDKDALNPHSRLNVANKIIARIQLAAQIIEPARAMQELGKGVKEAIDRRLSQIKDDTFPSPGKSISYYKEEAEKQLENLVEYFWVAVPFVIGDYAATRKKLEALIAARKNTRDFSPVTWGGDRPKSSIDGQLESVIPENRYPQRTDSEDTKFSKVQALYKEYRAAPAERLSGVDLLKRLGSSKDEYNFPATSHIAAIPFLERLRILADTDASKAKTAKTLWETYTRKVGQLTPDQKLEYIPQGYVEHPILGNVEGSLLFEDRLGDLLDLVKRDSVIFTQVREARKALGQFYDCLGKKRPGAYFVILHADGDWMGRVIDATARQGYDQHRELSRNLYSFAGNVSNIVEKQGYQGALVYAGGDDVLAFLPLHTALKCARNLAQDFQEKLANFKDKNGHSPTLSVGIAVVHHLHPLWDALNIARAAEKRAKQHEGKNALAITIRKRSGGEYTVVDSWGKLDKHLDQLITYYCNGDIPGGTAYELRDMLLRLTPSDSDSVDLRKVLQTETRRILQRKLEVSQKELEQESHKRKVQVLVELLGMLGIPTSIRLVANAEAPHIQIEQFIHTLLAAQQFAEARNLALLDKGDN